MLGRMSEQPLVRIVRGVPTAEELAALVGALLTRTPPGDAPVPVPSRWATSTRPGTAGRPAPGAWRAAALPR